MFSGSRTVRIDARYRASVRAPATALSVVFRQHRSHAYPGSSFLRQQGFRACSVQGSRFADMLSEEINLTQMVEGIMPSYYTQKCSTFPPAARYLTTWLFIGSLLRYNLGALVIPSLQTAGSHVISPISTQSELPHQARSTFSNLEVPKVPYNIYSVSCRHLEETFASQYYSTYFGAPMCPHASVLQ